MPEATHASNIDDALFADKRVGAFLDDTDAGSSGKVFRGSMFLLGPSGARLGGTAPNVLAFQYNPETIGVSFSGDVSTFQSAPAAPGVQSFNDALATVQFDLLFDRTEEYADGRLSDGAYHDIRHLQVMYGIFTDQGVPSTPVGTAPVATSGGGSIQPKMTQVQFSDAEPFFSFKGIVTSLGVEFTYFGPDMVPLRATVAVVMSNVQSLGPTLPTVAATPAGLGFNPSPAGAGAPTPGGGAQAPPPAPAPSAGFIWPVHGPITQEWRPASNPTHTGIDIGVGNDTPVAAARSGTVSFVGWNNGGYGNLVILAHDGGYETYYAHNNSFNVSQGQAVSQGEVVAFSDSTGNSTGPHVHFEVRLNGVDHNPREFIPGNP